MILIFSKPKIKISFPVADETPENTDQHFGVKVFCLPHPETCELICNWRKSKHRGSFQLCTSKQVTKV